MVRRKIKTVPTTIERNDCVRIQDENPANRTNLTLIRISESAKTKKPPGNWAASSFQGRIVPTEAKPSKLSEEIL